VRQKSPPRRRFCPACASDALAAIASAGRAARPTQTPSSNEIAARRPPAEGTQRRFYQTPATAQAGGRADVTPSSPVARQRCRANLEEGLRRRRIHTAGPVISPLHQAPRQDDTTEAQYARPTEPPTAARAPARRQRESKGETTMKPVADNGIPGVTTRKEPVTQATSWTG